MLLAMKTLKCYWCVSIHLFVTSELSFIDSQIVGYQSLCRCQFCLSPSISLHGADTPARYKRFLKCDKKTDRTNNITSLYSQ